MIDKLSALLKSTEVEELVLTVKLKGATSAPGIPGDPGEPSPVVPLDPSQVSDPPAVQNLQAERLGPGSCKLSWEIPAGIPVAHVYINAYRGTKVQPFPVWLEPHETSWTYRDLPPDVYRFEPITVVKPWEGADEAYGYTSITVDLR